MVRDCPECYNDGLIAGAEAMQEQIKEFGSGSGLDLVERARLTALDSNPPAVTAVKKPKRKANPRNALYSKAFKSIESDFKKKNGSWKKNGFKNCAKKANGMCK